MGSPRKGDDLLVLAILAVQDTIAQSESTEPSGVLNYLRQGPVIGVPSAYGLPKVFVLFYMFT